MLVFIVMLFIMYDVMLINVSLRKNLVCQCWAGNKFLKECMKNEMIARKDANLQNVA